jgi:pentalenolactone synthase
MTDTHAHTAFRAVTTPAGDPAWLVSAYDDVKALLADPRLGRSHADPVSAPRFSTSAIFGGPQGDPATEAADHTRMRRLLAPAFSARRMARLRPRIESITADLLTDLLSRPCPADFHEAVSFPLPALVICELLGVPYADRADFRVWSDDAGRMDDPERSLAALGQLWAYMGELVRRKQSEPGQDVISDLVAAARHDPALTDETIAQLSAGLLFAGHETTVTAIDRGVTLLLTHPDQREALSAVPGAAGRAVEEILRSPIPFRSARRDSFGWLPRYATADLEFGGMTIRAGELVVLDLQAANVDDDRFPAPDRFDVGRGANPHLAFGYGYRFCVGAPLARIELETLFGTLFTRIPTLRLAVDPAELTPREELLTGGLVELPVTW